MTMSVGPGFQLAFKHENCNHNVLDLKIKGCLSAMEGLAKSRRLRTLYQTAYLLLARKISPMTNGLLTDLGLSISRKLFFENFIDECV